MKFKTVFVIFNSVLVLCFSFIFFLPFIAIGSDYVTRFLTQNLITGLLFITTLVVINVYFLKNWTLFTLMERQEWPKVVDYLENKIYIVESLKPLYIRTLINTYFVTSNAAGIHKLEQFLQTKKNQLVARFAMQFGISYLLTKDPKESEEYFNRMRTLRRVRKKDWIIWSHSLSLIQNEKYSEARSELLILLDNKLNPLLRLITLYLLNSLSRNAGAESEGGHENGFAEAHVEQSAGRFAERFAERCDDEIRSLRNRYTREYWDREIEKASGDMEVVALSKLIGDAISWLFEDERNTDNISPVDSQG